MPRSLTGSDVLVRVGCVSVVPVATGSMTVESEPKNILARMGRRALVLSRLGMRVGAAAAVLVALITLSTLCAADGGDRSLRIDIIRPISAAHHGVAQLRNQLRSKQARRQISYRSLGQVHNHDVAALDARLEIERRCSLRQYGDGRMRKAQWMHMSTMKPNGKPI